MPYRIVVKGIVQGVGFRPTVARVARALGLRGYVRNVGSFVEIVVSSSPHEFLEALRRDLPPLARIEEVEVEAVDVPLPNGFVIERSADAERLSLIPPDTATCDECLAEMFNPRDRRYLYPFTSCTYCGPRFTTVRSLPYDRDSTAFSRFPLCRECESEYGYEGDRRYHAQTTCCPECGPHYTLYDSSGEVVETDDPLREYARLVEEGNICVAKSWGGMHINVILDEIPRFREWYRRPQKPFAVMFRDLRAVEVVAHVSDVERDLLTSPARPIVLVRKKSDDDVWEWVAPGLPNIGAYLPYSGFHHILFHHLQTDYVVSTSANMPGRPMITRNEEAFTLGADYYLLHDLPIENRCDDSLLRVVDGDPLLIRRSRGYVPLPLPFPGKGRILAMGAQMSMAGLVTTGGKAYFTQYIGNSPDYEVLEYLRDAVAHLRSLLGVESLEAVAVDMNPRYTSRMLGRKIAEREDVPLVEVQHHHAHAASLMAEWGEEEMFVLTFDGTGYGTDGASWGGELLLARPDGFERVASLQYLPLPGGDAAVREPGRILKALKGELKTPFAAKSSSMGRLMDALSAALGICDRMTYEGEPAMKLERHLREVRGLDVEVRREEGRYVIMTSEHLLRVADAPPGEREEMASSLVVGVLDAFIHILEEHSDMRIPVGISGGVSYNEFVVRHLRKRLDIRTHRQVPPGDGGIALGQALVAESKIK